MMKTGKNKRLLASILAASMLLAMSPFALAEGAEGTTGQEQSTSQSAEVKTEGEGTGIEQEKPETSVNAAKIGENVYPTVAKAIDAANIYDANSDVTIVMLHDVTENIEIHRSLTLDLGGFKLSGDGTKTVVSISGENMDVTVKNGTVTGGKSTYGGGVNIQNVAGTVTLDNCTITKNEASNAGGGVYIASSGTVRIKNGKITENNAANSGAGIYVTCGINPNEDGNLSCILDGVMIEANTSNSTGGGIVASGNHPNAAMVTVEMEDGTSISHNTAKTSLDGYGGGGVYITGSATRFIMNGGTISDNEALCGAGIHSATRDGLEINGGSIVDNVATGDGGGIYAKRYKFQDKYDKLLIANKVIVSNNKAKKNGGGLWIGDNLNATIEKGSQVYNNRADIMGDDIYFSGTNSTLNLPAATEMSGDLILTSDETPITDWYYDGFKDASTRHRWGEKYSELDIDATRANGALTYKTGIYYEIFKPVENFKGTIALKAAHAQLFTLTYNVTGDLPEGYTAPTAQSMLVGSSYTVADVPASVSGSKDGVNGTFSFDGWKKDDGTVLTGEQKLTEDLTLHGVWTFTKKSSGGGTDPIEWNVSRSKTATALDTNTWTSNVTLSLPSAEEALASDVVFVLDKSTSTELEDQALGMLAALKDQAASTEAKVKVGVVIFNKEANVTPLTDLATGYETIENAIKQEIRSGTNTHAGLLAGKQMLDEDNEVAANRKYLIFVSDGITYMYNAEPTATAWSFMADSWNHWANPENWNSKYGNNNPPDDWSAWMTEIGTQVKDQGTQYEYPYEPSGKTATNWTPEDDTYKNYANSIDKALYLTYQVYQEAQTQGYNCYAVANESSTGYSWGPAFMHYLANGQTVDFDKIQNDILYAVSAGSTVEDQMGDAFDFVPGSLKLTVGGTELKSKANGNMTYFGDDVENLSENNCRFKVLYAPDTDAFVWTINENVSNFAPVQLTYTVKLTKPETDPGTYGTEDLKGEKDVPADKALFTNKRAVLNAINSAGAQLKPLDFPKPSVSYTVKKSSSGGGGGGGRRPTVTIPDDVPTGLNGDDHYAYIVGYPNGNVEPNGNITRAEVATIFFRLLTEKVRTANSTQSNSLSDVTRGQWFNHAVSTLSSMGIVKGHNDGTFAPNAPITRAEFAAIAARFDDKNTDTSSKFTDIASHWAKNEIGIAANKGWINGYPDGTFRPNQYITRAEAMTLVNRVLNRLPENSSDLLDSMIKWPDNSDASQWFYLAVQEATNSHYYKTKENKFEKWTELRETRDWTELEK